MIEKGNSITIKLTDEWPDEVAIVVGRISIAFAQMTREVYLAAKRKKGIHLAKWESDNPSDNLSKWIARLQKDHGDDSVLIQLVDRADKAGKERHTIFHAIWGRKLSGQLGRWRQQTDLGIEVEPMQNLLQEIRDVRDCINRHTRIVDKYSLKQTIATNPVIPM